MAGLMSRASAVVKARLSKLLDRAEDPSVTLDYSYEKQREMLQDVKRGVADVVTAKKRLQLQATQLEQSVVKLEAQAREAVGRRARGPRAAGARAQVGRAGAAARARRADRRRSSSSRSA